MLSLDAVAILYTERKLFQAVSTPLSRHLLPFAWKFNFWPFTPICACLRATPWSHLRFYWQNYYHWVPSQWYLRKRATPGYYNPIFLPYASNSIFGHFWPFFTICVCSWVTPWSHPCFNWQKCYHWVLLQWNLRKKSCSRSLQPYFSAICLKFNFWPFLAIFDHFSPFLPTHGRPHDPTSAFIY